MIRLSSQVLIAKYVEILNCKFTYCLLLEFERTDLSHQMVGYLYYFIEHTLSTFCTLHTLHPVS